MKPLVTILLATYNRAHFIVDTLESIQKQTYTNWECIVIDDYSIDNTRAVVDEFVKKDNRFNYCLKNDNYKKGLSGTRNQGLDIAATKNAEYIQLFDDDDIMHPLKLELQMKPFIKDVNLDFTLCKYRHFYADEQLKFELKDEDCTIVSLNLFEDFYLGKMGINSLGPIWKSSLLQKYRFDEDLIYGEERDLYLKLFLKDKPKYKNIDFVLFYYRKHKESNTSDRYSSKEILLSIYKSNLNLYYFVQENKLWNPFLFKELLKFFFIKNFNLEISKEILAELKKNKLISSFKSGMFIFILKLFHVFRMNCIRILNKLN